jgi:hypothetical protein
MSDINWPGRTHIASTLRVTPYEGARGFSDAEAAVVARFDDAETPPEVALAGRMLALADRYERKAPDQEPWDGDVVTAYREFAAEIRTILAEPQP